MCNDRNHALHASNVPTNPTLLEPSSARIFYHLNSGTIVLDTRCHFIFKTKENTIFFCPIIQKLGHLAAIVSSRRCAKISNMRIHVYLSTDQIFLNCTTKNHLIPSIRKFEKFPPIRTTEVPDRTHSIFIKEEEDPILSQDPEHNQKPLKTAATISVRDVIVIKLTNKRQVIYSPSASTQEIAHLTLKGISRLV